MFGGLEPRAWRAREREPITGVWRQSPQRGPGAQPLVAPEAENLSASGCATEGANLPHSVLAPAFKKLINVLGPIFVVYLGLSLSL